MSWLCTHCGMSNDDLNTLCDFCREAKPDDIVSENEDVKSQKYACPSCGRVYSYRELENGPVRCKCTERVTLKNAKIVIEQKPANKCLFIREVRAVRGESDDINGSIRYYPTSIEPEYISDEIPIGNNYVFGRYSFPYPEEYKHISQEHCSFFIGEDGLWYIKGYPTTNGTFLNNTFLADKQVRALNENDQLQFADKLFRVIIR